MRIAINTVCMPELTWSEALAACKTAGFENIELLAIPGWAHVDIASTPTAEVAEKADAIGVKIAGIHGGGIDGASDDGLASTVAYLRRAMAYAAQLGAERLVFSGHGWPEDLTDARRSEILERIAAGVSQLADDAAGQNVKICLENHYRCQIETLQDYRDIYAALSSDNAWIGATVDTGHFTSSQVDPVAVVRGLGPRVLNVHVKDHIGTESMALGAGRTDNAGVAAALAEIGYQGDLTVEMEVHDRANALQYVRDAWPYMVDLVATAMA